MNFVKFFKTGFTSKYVSVIVFFGLVLFSSCKEATVDMLGSSNEIPKNGYEALSQTLNLVSYRVRSQQQVNDILMFKISQMTDPSIREAYTTIAQNPLINKFFASDARARMNGDAINLDEINKELNSSNISSEIRKKIFNFGKNLEKIKENAVEKSSDADKEILDEILSLENSVKSDNVLKSDEKIMILGITQVLKNNYSDIKKSAEQAVANGRVSCWYCWVVNAVVTIVVVGAAVGIVTIAVAVTGVQIVGGDVSGAFPSIAIVGGIVGVVAGIAAVSSNDCFVVWDYNQVTIPSYGWFGIQLGPC